MIELEYMPIQVQAHHDYLRALAAPAPVGAVVLRRQTIGRLIIRFGRWLEHCRPDSTSSPLTSRI